jgi:hypothetical protein
MISSDPISYTVSKIMSTGIDKTVLELAYGGMNNIGIRKNVAQEIDKVLAKYVCNDFNLISGDVIDIPVGKCKLVPSSDGRVYIVPAEARRNRDIREVLTTKKKTYIHATGLGLDIYPVTGSSIIDGISAMSSNMNTTQATGNTFVELEDDNVIRVTSSDGSFHGYDTFVVEIENRDRLKKLKKGSYPLFAKIAISYIKAHIYANRIAINKASIYGGHELSEISSVISEFSGAQDEYDTYMDTEAGKMLIFSDESKLNSLYQHMV